MRNLCCSHLYQNQSRILILLFRNFSCRSSQHLLALCSTDAYIQAGKMGEGWVANGMHTVYIVSPVVCARLQRVFCCRSPQSGVPAAFFVVGVSEACRGAYRSPSACLSVSRATVVYLFYFLIISCLRSLVFRVSHKPEALCVPLSGTLEILG